MISPDKEAYSMRLFGMLIRLLASIGTMLAPLLNCLMNFLAARLKSFNTDNFSVSIFQSAEVYNTKHFSNPRLITMDLASLSGICERSFAGKIMRPLLSILHSNIPINLAIQDLKIIR